MKLNIQLFASSKTITKTIKDSYNNSYTLTATINESLPANYIETNKTYLSGTVKVSNTGAGGAYTSSKVMSATMSFLAENSSGSTLASATGSCKFDFRGDSTVTVTPLTYSNLEISHNTDGSRTIYIKLVLKVTDTSLAQTQTYTDTLALTTIPRASTITSVSDITTPAYPSIVWTPNSSDFKYKVEYVCGENTFTSSLISPNSTYEYTYYGLQVTDDAFRGNDSTQLTATAILYTYANDGETLIGTPDTETFTVDLSSYVKPSVSITDITTSGVPSGWGVYVQNKSVFSYKVYVSSAVPSASSQTLTTYIGSGIPTQVVNPPYQNNFTKTPTSAGTFPIVARVKDSRNRETIVSSSSYTIVAYSDPTITQATAVRCDASGNTSDSGTKVKYTFVGSISPVSNNNSKLFRIGYRIKGSLSSFTYKTIVDNAYTVNVTTATVISDWTLSTDYAYEFSFEAIDYFRNSNNPVSVIKYIETGFDLMNFNESGKAMAIGKVSEASSNEELLEIDLPTKVTKDITQLRTSGDTYHRITTNNKSVDLMVANNGNRGIYDRTNSKWLIYTDGTNDYLGTANKGNTNRPIYLNAGKPTICNTPTSGAYFDGVPYVNSSDGVMEIGKYIDFHNTNASTNNYDTRIQCNGATQNILTLPTATGTLALKSDLTKNILRVSPSSDTTISSTGEKKLTLASNDFQNGSSLSISDGGIKIGSGITKVFVSGTIYFSASTNAGDSLRAIIKKGTTTVAINYARAGTNGTYEVRNIIPTPISVAENDIIYLYYNNATGGRGKISSAEAETYLVVEQIL